MDFIHIFPVSVLVQPLQPAYPFNFSYNSHLLAGLNCKLQVASRRSVWSLLKLLFVHNDFGTGDVVKWVDAIQGSTKTLWTAAISTTTAPCSSQRRNVGKARNILLLGYLWRRDVMIHNTSSNEYAFDNG
jgi:hypothetical protein